MQVLESVVQTMARDIEFPHSHSDLHASKKGVAIFCLLEDEQGLSVGEFDRRLLYGVN